MGPGAGRSSPSERFEVTRQVFLGRASSDGRRHSQPASSSHEEDFRYRYNTMSLPHLLGMWTPSTFELIVIAIIALLLFGKRLPEVARSLGKGVVEFKKGIRGVEEDVDHSSYQTPKQQGQQPPYTNGQTQPQQPPVPPTQAS
jgi:sec-independent protein translocase protein TatA